MRCPSVDGSTPANPITAEALDIVELTGENSYAPDGDELAYEWSILTYPQDSLTTIDAPQDAEPSIEIDVAGYFLVELSVYDEGGLANCEVEFLEINP